MLTSTKGIVISKIRYRDNDIILKCYTEELGVVSFFLRGVYKTKKGKFSPAYFQSLTQLELNFNYKKGKGLQNLSDVKLINNYQSIYNDITKSAIVLFLSEILLIVLKEEEKNTQLFQYLLTSLLWLDEENNPSNFHLLFVLNLTKYLGFFPDTSHIHLNNFNLEEGRFEVKNSSVYSISGENLTVLKQLLGTKFDTLDSIKINAVQRHDFLNMILLYFELHLGGFKKPKSLSILNQVFS